MATLRELKGRIGSVASSEKITGAMKMISSAKMHKAESELKKQDPFRANIQAIIQSLVSANADISSPLLNTPDVKKISILVWGSDEGLCGAYNVNIYKQLIRNISALREKYGQDVSITIIPVGNKMVKITSKIKSPKIEVKNIDGLDAKAQQPTINNLHETLINQFLSGETNRIEMLYMHFKSISRQSLTMETMLPISPENFTAPEDNSGSGTIPDYIFEPDTKTVFQTALPLYLLSTLTEIFTQNRASQQAARVMAMQSANDNARKLLEQLRLEYNKLRQQSITTELLDIVGGQIR